MGVRVEEIAILMDSVTIRLPAERRQSGNGVEIGNIVQALVDGDEFEAGDVGVVTNTRTNAYGSYMFHDKSSDVFWPGNGRSTTERWRSLEGHYGRGPFFETFKRVGHRATICMSLALFLQLSKPLLCCSECNAQFETDNQVQQHTKSVHRGHEHRYRKPKTKRERFELHEIRTKPYVLTIHPIQVDPWQFRLSVLSLNGDEFIPSFYMAGSETVCDLITAIHCRPELAVSGGY